MKKRVRLLLAALIKEEDYVASKELPMKAHQRAPKRLEVT